MGGCQNYGPFLGTLSIRCRTIIGTQKGDHNFDNHPYRDYTRVVQASLGDARIYRVKGLYPKNLESNGKEHGNWDCIMVDRAKVGNIRDMTGSFPIVYHGSGIPRPETRSAHHARDRRAGGLGPIRLGSGVRVPNNYREGDFRGLKVHRPKYILILIIGPPQNLILIAGASPKPNPHYRGPKAQDLFLITGSPQNLILIPKTLILITGATQKWSRTFGNLR